MDARRRPQGAQGREVQGKAGGGESVANTKASSFAIGADYALSKRSMVYAQHLDVTNKAGGNYGLGAGQGSGYNPVNTSGGTSGAAGNDPSAFSVGVRHSF